MLALSLLATFLPSLALSSPFSPSSLTAAGCCSCPQNVPKNFTISDFNLFLASSGSTPDNSCLSFSFFDPQNNVSTSCSREVTAAQAAAGQSIDDANDYYECENADVSFLFSQPVFSVVEKFLCNGQTLLYTRTATSNNTNFQAGLECFPSEGTPLGTGTHCEIAGGDTDVVPVTAVSPQSVLQKQAIEEAKAAFSRLPKGNAVFQQCIEQKETLADVVSAVTQKCQSFKKKRFAKLLETFQRRTLWLQNIGSVVDVVVQTQAGIGCPLWAPIKFVLKVSDDHAQAVQQTFSLIQMIAECLPRFEIYEKLRNDNTLQVALLNVFTDVVEFSVQAFQFFGRGKLVRFTRIVRRTFDQEFGDVIARLEHRAKIVDQTVVAVELLRAAEYRRESDLKHREEMNLRFEKWLRPSNVRDIHNQQVTARLDGTCNWIISDPAFKKWIDLSYSATPDRILCISGKHGCGKSVLASSIVIRLEEELNNTVFFSFSSTDANRSSSENLIRTIFWQLVRKGSDVKSLDIMRGLMSKGQPIASELWDSLDNILEPTSGPTYCIVDGIDECSDFDNGVTQRILKLLDACPNLRITLLGRTHTIQALFQSTSDHVCMIEIIPTLLNQDMESFIEAEISRSDILRLSGIRDRVFATIKEKSDGMFLWVKLMLKDLQRSSTRPELVERLQNLPRGLEEAYGLVFSRLLQKLDSFELRLVQRVFAFIIVSCRPLNFEEFRHCYALYRRSIADKEHPMEEYLLLYTVERLLDLCGGLVSVMNGFVCLIHSSVKDFLLRSQDRWIEGDSSPTMVFRINLEETHQALASLSLDYLDMEKDGLTSDQSDFLQNSKSFYPFLEYALLYAVYHVNRSGPLSMTTLGKIQKIIESAQGIMWVERFAALLMEDPSLDSQTYEILTLQASIRDTGVTLNLFAIFETHLRRQLAARNRSCGREDLSVERWQMFLGLAEDGVFDTLREISGDGESGTKAEDTLPRPKLEAPSKPLKICSEDPSEGVSQIIKLLNSQTTIPGVRQVEVLLRLQLSLQHIRVMMDPLKVLFQLILRKASSVPVYVLMGIGHFYLKLDKYAEGLEVFRAASKKVDHLEVPVKYLASYWTGACRYYLKEYQEALACFQVAYNGDRKLLGEQHPDTLYSLEWIGECHYYLEEYQEALACFQVAYNGDRKLLGERHRDTLYSLEWIGECHHSLKEYQEALACFQVVFDGRKALLGDRHCDTLYSLEWIGDCHHSLKEYQEALACFQGAFDGRKALLGDRHYDTLTSLQWIGDCCYYLKEYQEALNCFQVVFEGRKDLLGERHCDTLKSLHWLGYMKNELGEARDALRICNQWFAGRESGVPELSVWWSVETHRIRGKAYRSLGQYKKSISIMENALSQWESDAEIISWTVSAMKFSIADTYCCLRHDRHALEWAWKSMAANPDTTMSEHELTVDTEDLIGDIYQSMGDSEGLEWLRNLYLKRENDLGTNHFRTQITKRQMDAFYDHDNSNEWDDIDEHGSSHEHENSNSYTGEESPHHSSRASSLISSHSSFIEPEEFSMDFEYPEVYLTT